MEGVRNPMEKNRYHLSFPMGLVFGWGNPYIFFSQMRFSLFFVFFEKLYSTPTPTSPLPKPAQELKPGSGADWGEEACVAPSSVGSGNCCAAHSGLWVNQDMVLAFLSPPGP